MSVSVCHICMSAHGYQKLVLDLHLSRPSVLLKNRKTKMVLQNFKGAKRMNRKSYRFAGLPLQEGNGCHLGGDFICCLINSPCSLIC